MADEAIELGVKIAIGIIWVIAGIALVILTLLTVSELRAGRDLRH